MKGLKSILVLAASSFALSGAAFAQEVDTTQPPESKPDASAVQTFDPAFFARFNPVTAYDMVRQLPGFSIDNGNSLRGFGATAGNVLIDGQRPSTKAISISDELSRISARDVARVELIGASAAGDVDVRGYTEIANVVLKESTGVQESTTFSGLLYYSGDHLSERVGATRAWKGKDFTARLQLQGTALAQRSETDTIFYLGQSTPTGTREEFGQQYLGELLISGALNWNAGPRDTLNLNARIMPRTFNVQSGATDRSTAGTPTQYIADDYSEEDILYLDIGGDWEHRFSPENSVKLVTVNSLLSWRPEELFEVFPGTGPRALATQIMSENKRGEHVLRGVWTTKPNADHTIEIGMETAFNYLDTDRSIANAIGAGPFVSQVLPVASTRVEELRGEVFINDNWRINPQWTLETGFTFEASRITQTGDATQERDFTYPKPRIVATWQPTAEDRISFGATRTVAQLNFNEFASVIQLVQNQLTIGNPDLQPAQTTQAFALWKKQLGPRGSVQLRAFYDKIDDVQDFVVIQTSPTTFYTGAGNIGDGTRWGAEFEVTYPLDDFGIKGGLVKLVTNGRESRVTDPITGEERPIANDFTFGANVEFRQDIPDLKLAWGGDYTFPGGEAYAFRLNEIQRRDFDNGDLDMFVETTYFSGMTVRFAIDNIGDSASWLDRRFYSPSRLTSNTVSSREFREQTSGQLFQLSVSGSF